MTRRTNLQGYSRINDGQAFDTIGSNIESQILDNPAAEIRYRKMGKVTYETYFTIQSADLRPLRDFICIDIAESRRALATIFEANLHNPNKLPSDIRVIKPNPQVDGWAVFFKIGEKK
jgi:hypothetical protein